MVNQQDARLFLTVLMELRDLPDNSSLSSGMTKGNSGICDGSRILLMKWLRLSHVQEERYVILNRWCDYRSYLFRRWPEYSGRINYPICVPPEEEHIHPCDGERVIYMRASNHASMWQGTYGQARYRLLQFMIDGIQRDHPQIIIEPCKNDPDLKLFKFY